MAAGEKVVFSWNTREPPRSASQARSKGLLSLCEGDDAVGQYIAGEADCPQAAWSVDYLQCGDGNEGQRSHKELVAGGVLVLRMEIQ